MAFTRAQKRAKTPHLPTELLAAIARQLSLDELTSLCRANRQLHEIAIRELYRSMHISFCASNSRFGSSSSKSSKTELVRVKKTNLSEDMRRLCETLLGDSEKAGQVQCIVLKNIDAAMSDSQLLVDALTKLPSLKVLRISYRGSWNFHPPSSVSVKKPINRWEKFFSGAATPLLRTLELHVDDIKPSSLLAFLRLHPSLEAIDFHSAVQYKTCATKGIHSDSLPQLSCLSCPVNWLRWMPSSGSLTTLSLYGIIKVGTHDSLLLTKEKLRPLTSIPSLKHLSIHLASSPKGTNLITCIGSFVPELEELVIKLSLCLCAAYFLSDMSNIEFLSSFSTFKKLSFLKVTVDKRQPLQRAILALHQKRLGNGQRLKTISDECSTLDQIVLQGGCHVREIWTKEKQNWVMAGVTQWRRP